MVKIEFTIELAYDILQQPADFIFNVHAASSPRQLLKQENFQTEPPVAVAMFSDPCTGNRYARLRTGPGPLRVRYDAVVDINHYISSPDTLWEVPVAELPAEVLTYIYPSRYCQSDRLRQTARSEFGHLPNGYWRVRAIQDWVHRRTCFLSGSSNSETSAIDTMINQAGVCRDFAHLMIAMCRALNIPARFVTGIDYGSDPIYGPTDFHAYVEVFLSDRWYLFDVSGMAQPMGLIRLGTGRDAADVSFATIFGSVISMSPCIAVAAIEDIAHGISLPAACTDAISTAGRGL